MKTYGRAMEIAEKLKREYHESKNRSNFKMYEIDVEKNDIDI